MQVLILKNQTHFVQFPDNNTGMMQIKAFRQSHPEFKRRKIRAVLQLMPEKVQMGVVTESE